MARRRPDPDDDDDADGAADGSQGPTDIGGGRDARVQFPFGTSADDHDLDGSADERPPPKRPPPKKKRSGKSLPAEPPGSRPHDDASLDGLEDRSGSPFASSDEGQLVRDSDEDVISDSDEGELDEDDGSSEDQERLPTTSSLDEEVVDLDDAEARATGEGPVPRRGSVSDLGPIGASGPLVIIDDEEEPDASSRYQASIVDDSGRLAGRASVRAPAEGDGKPKRRPTGRTRRPSKEGRVVAGEEDDVPIPEPDRPPPPPPRARAPFVVAAVAILLAIGAVVASELRLRAEKAALQAAFDRERDALRKQATDAVAEARRDKDESLGRAAAEAEAKRQAERGELERAAAVARDEAVKRARAEAEAAAAAGAERAAREAVAVELARAEAEKTEAVDRAVGEAVGKTRAEEQGKAEAALADLARSEAERRARELEELRRELEAQLSASATRAEEEELARALAAAREGDAPAGGTGGGAASGGSEFDDFFSDSPGTGTGAGASDATDLEGEGALSPPDQVVAWARDNLHGSVGYKNLSHFSTGPNHDLRKTRHELRVKLEYRGFLWRSEDTTKGLRLETVLDFREDDDDYSKSFIKGVDDEEDERPHLWPEELHLDLLLDAFTLRGGWQIYAWGTGDLFNPTDTINPIDYSDLFDTRRISVLSLSGQLSTRYVSLEGVVVPTFTRSRLPLQGKRFDVLQSSPLPILRPDDPDDGIDSAQFGARATGHVGGWDVSLCGYAGRDDLPSAEVDVLSLNPLALVVDPVFDKLYMAGADFATTLGFLGVGGKLGDILGGIQLHGELASFFYEGPRADDYLQVVVGTNYTWVDLILEHDLTLVLEYTGDWTIDDAEQVVAGTRLNRILRGAVLARVLYAVDEDLSFEVNTALITHGPENALIHPAATWNATDNLRFILGGDIFLGPEETFFGQFKRDGRVTFEARVVF